MSRVHPSHRAWRLGHWLGRGWRAYQRRERGWKLAWRAKGLPAGAASVLLWAVKLLVLGVLLYVAFWVTLLLMAGLALAAWGAMQGGAQDADVWPFTHLDQARKTAGYDPNLYHDVSDVNYTDD
ncbi:Uncharacterised protein [Delftia tsuruhatensis]|uniref:DUF3742 family protein n=1 Tax=Delftia tsuruhatensis TaxID=180282 RepID=UPI001E766A88|nr:DUF3742 family protein [Delftia tsuruhatensis]CAB5671281.1 Uncharacterised protein [Delftia tsuruhatensis]CAC9683185.1 Uncharacterised protein [Delftia tsuruhatensis]